MQLVAFINKVSIAYACVQVHVECKWLILCIKIIIFLMNEYKMQDSMGCVLPALLETLSGRRVAVSCYQTID